MPFIDTKNLEPKQPLPGWEGRFINSEKMTFGYYAVTAGSTIHEHSHLQEEVWHVIEGQLEVTIDGETAIAGEGCVAVIPPHVSHSVRVLVDSKAIVVDSPTRKAVGAASTA